MRSFSTWGIGKKGGSRVDFFKNSCNLQNSKSKKYNKLAETGRKKVISGSRDHHPGRNCAANAMECLPDPQTAKKKIKNAKNVEKSRKSWISIFSYRSPMGALYAVWGHRCVHLENLGFLQVALWSLQDPIRCLGNRWGRCHSSN